jgi:hypothetical protein
LITDDKRGSVPSPPSLSISRISLPLQVSVKDFMLFVNGTYFALIIFAN